MKKRYQVFVSSTFTDLQHERQKVLNALMKIGCIPASMEFFSAVDEEQWNVIKRVIDDCDYYVLIVGGRYGSLTPDGISYTEKEYQYAKNIGLNILAFIHDNPGEISFDKSESDPVRQNKLVQFRNEVKKNRMVDFWTDSRELPGQVAVSVCNAIYEFPAVGWVRANAKIDQKADSEKSEVEVAKLQKRVYELEEIISSSSSAIASFDDKFTIHVSYYKGKYLTTDVLSISWKEILSCISPSLISNPNDELVNVIIGASLLRKYFNIDNKYAKIHVDEFQTIRVQLTAYKLIEVKYLKTVNGRMGLFWILTQLGHDTMIHLRTVKTAALTSNDVNKDCPLGTPPTVKAFMGR